ncbi:DUF2058 domain-containing protein [Thermochromatium tepidum]|uniref:DUF2058 family protein n=1 Tax=Thermochromatium tepidum ATCC 43061 TaxID=316276 RepID=A0A6I6EDN0_THETI|nr:DUF2058 domain-containing protein [Thermochromatium tepidum]QGU33079.1 DUF2058 family protein [Thermochromatium tepidum ATCC 43061]
MGNSLQEQLLKAGLVNEQKLKQARADRRKQIKQTGGRPTAEAQAAQAAAERARAEKLARDRELNRQYQEKVARRAAENEIRQLIHTHRVVRDGGDLAYNFTDGSTLKRLYVNKDQHAKLVAGRLAIVRQDNFYELVPAEIAERVQAHDASLVLVFNRSRDEAKPDDPFADDPYAEYQVPDDLIW